MSTVRRSLEAVKYKDGRFVRRKQASAARKWLAGLDVPLYRPDSGLSSAFFSTTK